MTDNTPTALADPPTLDVDPFADEIVDNPHPFHEILRDAAPVVWVPLYNVYATGRHEEVRTIMSDWQRFSNEAGLGMSDIREPGSWRDPSPIAEVDPPRHTKVRQTLNRIISPKVLRQWREDFVEEAERVVLRAIEKSDIDAVADLIEPYLLKVLPDALGVDMPRDNFLLIGEMNFNQIGPNNERTKASVARAAGILPLYAHFASREAAKPSGFAEQIHQAEADGDFEPGTAGPHVRSFLRAGVDTTIAAIGHTLHQLARNPAAWSLARQDPAVMKVAFEEGMRIDTPSQVHFRLIVEDTELSGMLLKKERKIMAFPNSANTDPRRWNDPYKFDLERKVTGQHTAFGYGPHVCAGQMIARMEAESLLGALARHVERLELLIDNPKIRRNNVLHTLDTLPLRLVAA
ncbi:cytochrome P450 [Rhizobium aquaticum]|uniref:Cytochrome P450 n=1 Tax=Rhizobium aquaticum TaxID=1549636 RepID=A0ABV2J905_9HYPH